MGSVSLFSLFAHGLDIHSIRVEVDLSSGLPGFHIVGLAGTVVQESKDRIRAALLNSGFEWPRGKITVNLAPADLHKVSSLFDVPIVLGILAAQGLLPSRALRRFYFVGELGLDGAIRGAQQMFLFAEWALRAKKRLVMPAQAAPLVLPFCSDAPLYSASSLRGLVFALRTDTLCAFPAPSKDLLAPLPLEETLDTVIGHAHAKRGLTIAAAGGHHVCLWGAPGAGKTVLARGFASLLPPLTHEEAADVLRIHSVRAQDTSLESLGRPFRAPHHSISAAALLGGGTMPTPGEISLAHRGVLFLDELAEFPRAHIDALRQPLTEHRITIGRAKYTCVFPAHFQLIAATNPCPCGYHGDLDTPCSCYETTRTKYLSKLSGPLLDRIDLHIHVQRQSATTLIHTSPEDAQTAALRARVVNAHAFRASRPHHALALSPRTLASFAFSSDTLDSASALADTHALSGRGVFKLLSIARTIADLEQSSSVAKPHLEEAWSFKEPLS